MRSKKQRKEEEKNWSIKQLITSLSAHKEERAAAAVQLQPELDCCNCFVDRLPSLVGKTRKRRDDPSSAWRSCYYAIKKTHTHLTDDCAAVLFLREREGEHNERAIFHSLFLREVRAAHWASSASHFICVLECVSYRSTTGELCSQRASTRRNRKAGWSSRVLSVNSAFISMLDDELKSWFVNFHGILERDLPGTNLGRFWNCLPSKKMTNLLFRNVTSNWCDYAKGGISNLLRTTIIQKRAFHEGFPSQRSFCELVLSADNPHISASCALERSARFCLQLRQIITLPLSRIPHWHHHRLILERRRKRTEKRDRTALSTIAASLERGRCSRPEFLEAELKIEH